MNFAIIDPVSNQQIDKFSDAYVRELARKNNENKILFHQKLINEAHKKGICYTINEKKLTIEIYLKDNIHNKNYYTTYEKAVKKLRDLSKL